MKTAIEIKPTIINVRSFNWRIQGVKFPKLNKNETISQYRQELQMGYNTQRVLVDEIMLFTATGYHVFCNNFLTDFDWLARAVLIPTIILSMKTEKHCHKISFSAELIPKSLKSGKANPTQLASCASIPPTMK